MTDEKIIAAVVTFNRKNLVPKTLAGLKAQTLPLSRVIVIDNASTDGTPDVLSEQGFLADPLFEYVRMDSNTGGAGGFNEGMRRALESSADWIWVMDDDVVAAPDCLEQLMKWRHVSECLHPRRSYLDGSYVEWEALFDIFTGARTSLADISFKHGKEIVFTNLACFEGMLVSSRVVKLAGLPDKKYFIGSDDTLFGLLASTYTNNAYIRDARMQRLLAPAGMTQPKRAYYGIRNSFYMFEDLCARLELSPSTSTTARFVLLRAFETMQSLKFGPRFFANALSGFVHGISYVRASRRKHRQTSVAP